MDLSVVMAGRNDNYGGDFRARALGGIRWNQECASLRGIRVEWIFVEWNPLDEDYLSYELARDYGFTCYIVAPSVHARVVHPDVRDRMTFCQFLAVNVGIRRAIGDWILCTHPDECVGPDVWDRLTDWEGNPDVLYRARRYDVPEDVFGTSWGSMTAGRGLDHGGGYTNAAGDFLLFAASRRRGFDEWAASFSDVHTDGRFVRNWIMERTGSIEWDHRYCQFIGTVYKADHPMIYRRSGGGHRGRPKWNSVQRKGQGPGLYANPETWGLAALPQMLLADKVWLIL